MICKNCDLYVIEVHELKTRIAALVAENAALKREALARGLRVFDAERADLHFHDLRHSAASAMINAGVPLYTVGAVLGHKAAASTKRYSHLDTTTLNDAVRKIGRKGVG